MSDWLEPQRPVPPPEAGALAERVADADRDRTIAMLREHVVVGRLTLDEFSDRVGLALESRTRGDLVAITTDLPVLGAPLPETTEARRPARRWHVGVMSGSSTKGRWRLAARTNAVAVMGGCEMDLRGAEIDGPEVVITAVAFWGGVEITVPEGFDVEMAGFSFMGGRDMKLRDVPIVPGSPRILVRGFAVMGGIEVRSRPSRTARQRNKVGSDAEARALPGGPRGRPIDLATLRREMAAQRRAGRHGGERHPGHWHEEEPAAPVEPAPAAVQPSDGTVTILFSDMVDYAGMTERLGDQQSRELLYAHHGIVRSTLERHGGREIKVQGDGFMVAFGGVARALRCAVEMQRAFQEYSETHANEPIGVHIGVHTGEAFEEDDDFLGHTVIVASRLASVAGPGEILVSSLSEQLVQSTGEFTFVDHREAVLKGMTRPQPSATLTWAD
jgi:class 3 adenylate cyclase